MRKKRTNDRDRARPVVLSKNHNDGMQIGVIERPEPHSRGRDRFQVQGLRLSGHVFADIEQGIDLSLNWVISLGNKEIKKSPMK